MGGVAGVGLLGLVTLTYSDFVKTLLEDKKLGFVEFTKQYVAFIGKRITTDKKCSAVVLVTLAAEAYALYVGTKKEEVK